GDKRGSTLYRGPYSRRGSEAAPSPPPPPSWHLQLAAEDFPRGRTRQGITHLNQPRHLVSRQALAEEFPYLFGHRRLVQALGCHYRLQARDGVADAHGHDRGLADRWVLGEQAFDLQNVHLQAADFDEEF